jgi:hypothetical protein
MRPGNPVASMHDSTMPDANSPRTADLRGKGWPTVCTVSDGAIGPSSLHEAYVDACRLCLLYGTPENPVRLLGIRVIPYF